MIRTNQIFRKWAPVTTAWRVLRLRMEERPAGMEGSGEYIERTVTDSRQGVVLHPGGLSEVLTNSMLRKVHNFLVLGLILWYGLSNG